MTHTLNNLEIAIKYVKDHSEKHDFKLPNETVLRLLHFLKQAYHDDLEIIGIGYQRFDGGKMRDLTIENMYEGGFLVNTKSSK